MKKKLCIAIILILLVLLLFLAVLVVIIGKPYFNVYKYADEVYNDSYTFEIEYILSGLESRSENILTPISGTIEGKKDGGKIYGKIWKDNSKIIELYIKDYKKCIFNIEPLIKKMIKYLSEYTDYPVNLLTVLTEDTYVSLDQLEEIVGQSVLEYLGCEDSSDSTKLKFSYKKIKAPKNMAYSFDAKNAEFFKISVKGSDVSVVVGIPANYKDKGDIYIRVKNDTIRLEMLAHYEMDDSVEVDMPEESFTDSQIQIFENIYNLWKEKQ